MKKVIGVIVVSCLLLVSMISVAAEENNECPFNGKGMNPYGCCWYDFS